MPGIVGYAGRDETARFLNEMMLALESDGRFHREFHVGPEYGLGRVGLNVPTLGTQPILSEDGQICLVMEGEFYNGDELKQALAKSSRVRDTAGDAELALALYRAMGPRFVELVNGAFVLAIWDQTQRALLILNDRLGLFPIYYTILGDRLLFASGVRALLAEPALPRCVDRVTIAELLTFDHALGQRTLIDSVKLLQQGAILDFRDERLTIESYWMPEHPEHYELRDEKEWAEDLLYHLRQAVRRQSRGTARPGLLLSGGLDSRVLLALLPEAVGAGKLRTFTWGIPGCDDERFARELASALGVSHDFLPLRSDWLLQLADEAVRITDGLGSITNLHALATAKQESDLVDVIYKGFLGDAMMGFAFRPLFWADYDNETRFRAHFQNYLDMRVLTFTPEEQAALFTDSFQSEVQAPAWEDFRAGMAESNSRQLANQRIHFDFRQRVPRMTVKGVEVVRSWMTVRLPYADNDLVDFTLRVPPGYWYQRQLIRTAFVDSFPALAKIPLSNTGLPMLACARDIRLRAQNFARWHLNRAGFSNVSLTGQRSYKDYNLWFRTALAPWTREVLLDRRSTERGYFRPEYIEHLVEEHMAGANHGAKLGALMSLELWHRQSID